MPVFKSGKGLAPPWCEMEYFEIVDVLAGATHTFERLGRKEKLIVCRGKCCIAFAEQAVAADRGTNVDLTTEEGQFEVEEVGADATLIRMCGRWGDEVGDSGIFTVAQDDQRQDSGDPINYAKETNFDAHFHDCDEYWIIWAGQGIVVSESRSYEVGPGDCVATGMGHHHDFPIVYQPVKAVFFETTLAGQKRRGHLWEHTHGPARPRPERT